MKFWPKTAAVLLALVLLFSSSKCLMACVAAPCAFSHTGQTGTPPCHGHDHTPMQHASPGCAQPFLVAHGAESGALLPDLSTIPLVVNSPVLAPLAQHVVGAAAANSASPPATRRSDSLILRI